MGGLSHLLFVLFYSAFAALFIFFYYHRSDRIGGLSDYELFYVAYRGAGI